MTVDALAKGFRRTFLAEIAQLPEDFSEDEGAAALGRAIDSVGTLVKLQLRKAVVEALAAAPPDEMATSEALIELCPPVMRAALIDTVAQLRAPLEGETP